MNKGEILAKSRSENGNRDLYELEVIKQAGRVSTLTVIILCAVLFTAEILLGHGINYGLWSIVLGIEAAVFTYKAIKLKKKHEIVVAFFYILMTAALLFSHFYNLTR